MTALLQTGQVHVGACSCSCRNESASKHWLWVQMTDRHGMSILRVDRGHLRDMMEDVASISVSFDLLRTIQ